MRDDEEIPRCRETVVLHAGLCHRVMKEEGKKKSTENHKSIALLPTYVHVGTHPTSYQPVYPTV